MVTAGKQFLTFVFCIPYTISVQRFWVLDSEVLGSGFRVQMFWVQSSEVIVNCILNFIHEIEV